MLKLSDFSLRHLPLLPIANFSSHAVLDLHRNGFYDSLMPSWAFGLSHLVSLDLSYYNFQGPIPDGLQILTSVKHIDLSFVETSIKELDLSYAQWNERGIPISWSKLCNLRSVLGLPKWVKGYPKFRYLFRMYLWCDRVYWLKSQSTFRLFDHSTWEIQTSADSFSKRKHDFWYYISL